MLVSTPGIVLHSTKYADTSLIVKIFTEAQGTQSFIIKGAFRKNSRFRASLFSPLAVLHITYDDHGHGQLKFLKDVTRSQTADECLYDPVKSAVLLFYNELLYQLLFETAEDPELFQFLVAEIRSVTDADPVPADLPIQFLVRLNVVLGYFPENNYSDKDCHFSLEQSRFQPYCLDERNDVPHAESRYLSQLLNGVTDYVADRQTRNRLLRYLIEYCKIHNDHIRGIESVEILSTILH